MSVDQGLRVIKKKSGSVEETKKYGYVFGAHLQPGDVVLLEGPLGAGKTVFLKGAAAYFTFKEEEIKSPTFTIHRQYHKGKIYINHLDMYRINRYEELYSFSSEEYFFGAQGFTFIEWGERIEADLTHFFKVKIDFISLKRRILSFSLKGYPRQRLQQLFS